MNYLIKLSSFAAVLLLVSACTSAVETESEPIDLSEPEVSMSEDDVNEGFELVERGNREAGDTDDIYSGEAVVSGTYTYAPQDPFFDLAFVLDEESKDLVPQSEAFFGRIYFTNIDAMEMLGLDGELEECEADEIIGPVYTGTATVKIDGYNSNLIEGEALDSTELVEVLENSGASCS